MSWGIAETAPEIEKIKAESADYLGGLNSCGEIEWGIYSQAFDFYADLIQKAYELGKIEAEPHWIPVEQELPEQDQICLVCGKNGGIYVARFWRNENIVLWTKTGTGKFVNAVAWMPLPKKYRGE